MKGGDRQCTHTEPVFGKKNKNKIIKKKKIMWRAMGSSVLEEEAERGEIYKEGYEGKPGAERYGIRKILLEHI